MRWSALPELTMAALSGLLLAACAPFGWNSDESATAGMQGQESILFSAVDENRDGAVTQEELLTYFLTHDSTEDGALDAGEFAAFESPEWAGPAHPRDGRTDALYSDFLRNPSPTGPEVAAPPALRERLRE